MKKDRLYLLTFSSLLFIVYALGYFSMNYLIDINTTQLLEFQMESSKREAKEFSSMISSQLDLGIHQSLVIKNIQKSIENTEDETGFICMFDWSGKHVCHPNLEIIGKYTGPEESFVSTINDHTSSEDFYDYLKNKKEVGGIRSFNNTNRASEIIYVYPVKNTDWIVAAHANIQKIKDQINTLKFKFIVVYSITGAFIVILSLITVRLIGSNYEKMLEVKNEKLSDEVVNLSKLNHDLISYKTKINLSETPLPDQKNGCKQRILTYSKNELLPLSVDQVACIYTENTITYILTREGEKSTSNSSLDDLYNDLDKAFFFRANRQFILSVHCINKILKYGNSQLKIEVLPKNGMDIIISKNKAAEFKEWLNR